MNFGKGEIFLYCTFFLSIFLAVPAHELQIKRNKKRFGSADFVGEGHTRASARQLAKISSRNPATRTAKTNKSNLQITRIRHVVQGSTRRQPLGVALVSTELYALCSVLCTLCGFQHLATTQCGEKTVRKAAEKNKCFLHVSSATVKVKRQLDKKVKTI